MVTDCHQFDPARRRGIIGPARPVRGDLSSGAGCCCPLLYSYVGRGRGWYWAGGAAVWCRCEVWPVWAAVCGCCPLLYSYVWRGGVRSPTGAGIICPARGVACPAAAGGGRDLLPARHHRPGARAWRRGAACPASSGGGRGIIGPARPVRGDLSSAAGCCCPLLYSYVGRRGAISYRRGIIEPPRKSRPRKTPHGKRATKKR